MIDKSLETKDSTTNEKTLKRPVDGSRGLRPSRDRTRGVLRLCLLLAALQLSVIRRQLSSSHADK